MIGGIRSLYRGDNDFDLIGKTKLFVGLSLVAIAVSVASLVFRGFDFGIEFEGGSLWVTTVATDVGESDVAVAAGRGGLNDPRVQFVTEAGVRKARVTSRVTDPGVVDAVRTELAGLPGATRDQVEVTSVGPTWGSQISRRAVQALVVFLVLVTVFISLRFEWKMALAALSALFHDMFITAGVYSLVGFEVVPATVIAMLTILGYSLYDTVVVFDKVQENTATATQTARQTYSETVNRSLNEVFMRSLNTSVTAVLPVGAILVVGLTNPAATTLKDFALALFVGLLSGTYSSVFFATPILAMLKEREPRYQQIRARLESRAGREAPRRAPTAEVASRVPAAPSGEDDLDGVDELDDAEADGKTAPEAPAETRRPVPSGRKPARGGARSRPGGRRRSGGKRRR